MTHSIEIPGDPGQAGPQVPGAVLLLAYVAQHPTLPRLAWTLGESGHLTGCRTAGPDTEVRADVEAWAKLLAATVEDRVHAVDGRHIYRVHVDRAPLATVTVTGVGVPARVDAAPLASTVPSEPDREYRRLSGEGLTEDQRRGNACVRCGLENPPVSVTVGYVRGDGQVFACDPGCPAPVEQPDPTDPAADKPATGPVDPPSATTPPTYWRDRVGRAWAAVDGTPESARLVDGFGLCIWSLARLRAEVGPLDELGAGAVPGARALPVWTRVEAGRYQRDAVGTTWTLSRGHGGWFLVGIGDGDERCGSYIDDARLVADTHIHDAEMYDAWVEEGRATTEEHDPDLGKNIDGEFDDHEDGDV